MVKRKSFLASNEEFRVRVLVGVLDKDVLLGEQYGSNPCREGSNPSILAAL
jgi:hypothetical protein